jgi:hypothetical protein
LVTVFYNETVILLRGLKGLDAHQGILNGVHHHALALGAGGSSATDSGGAKNQDQRGTNRRDDDAKDENGNHHFKQGECLLRSRA